MQTDALVQEHMHKNKKYTQTTYHHNEVYYIDGDDGKDYNG